MQRSRIPSSPKYAIAGAALLVAVACDEPRISGVEIKSSASSVATERAGQLLAQPNRFPRGIEDEILRLETELPGFGGFYFDENGDVVAISVGVTPDVRVQGRVAEYIQASGSRFARSDGSLPQVSIRRGDYAFSQLLDYLFKVRALLTREDDIVLLDADEQRNRLRLGIGSAGSLARAYDLARRAGFDTAALYLESVPEYPRATLGSLRDKWRATFAGIQTKSAGADCSMGFHVTDSVGTSYFLTAGHCTGNFNGPGATVFYQNTATTANQVGVEDVNPAWDTSGCLPTVTYCRLTDAALVRFDSPSFASKWVGQSSSVGSGSGSGNLLVGATYPVATQGDAASGTTVYRTGRTTGSTVGAIVGTCVDVGPISNIYFYTEVYCGSEVTAYSDAGDSGGPVYHWRIPLVASARQADGILYAGGIISGVHRYWYNSWTQLESTMGRSLTAY